MVCWRREGEGGMQEEQCRQSHRRTGVDEQGCVHAGGGQVRSHKNRQGVSKQMAWQYGVAGKVGARRGPLAAGEGSRYNPQNTQQEGTRAR